MKTFQDADGRQWQIKLTLDSLERVEKATGVALDDIATNNPASLLAIASAVTLGNVLWHLVEPEAVKRGVLREQFADAMGGEQLDNARNELIQEQIEFSPRHWRDVLTATVREQQESEKKALAAELKKVRKRVAEKNAQPTDEVAA